MTRVLYDNTGKVFDIRDGYYEIPQGGINYLEVDVPAGKHIVSVDTTVAPHVVVLEDNPVSDVDILKVQVADLTLALAEMMGV